MVSLVIGTILTGGCVGKEVETPAQEKEVETPAQETLVQIIEDITVQEAFTLIQESQNDPDFVIIDVRTPKEFADGYIENAANIDFRCEDFRDELNKLDKSKTYLIYCGSGGRSRSALDIVKELNFREVYNMSGGINQWVAEGFPIVRRKISAILPKSLTSAHFSFTHSLGSRTQLAKYSASSSRCSLWSLMHQPPPSLT